MAGGFETFRRQKVRPHLHPPREYNRYLSTPYPLGASPHTPFILFFSTGSQQEHLGGERQDEINLSYYWLRDAKQGINEGGWCIMLR